jgi:hypothetical protein
LGLHGKLDDGSDSGDAGILQKSTKTLEALVKGSDTGDAGVLEKSTKTIETLVKVVEKMTDQSGGKNDKMDKSA